MSEQLYFGIEPIERFNGPPVTVRRPQEFACFSYDENHHYHPDDRSLRYYYPPRLGTNLCLGFENFRNFDDSKDEHLDSLLQTLMKREKDTSRIDPVDFVTWRGMMTKIMANPYDNSEFEMNATKFQETIFIEENHEHRVKSRAEQALRRMPLGMPSQDMMSFWGYKFETISTLPSPWDATSREFIESRENKPVQNYAQYCSVVRTSIGSSKLILGGEVDAIWDQKPKSPDDSINWVELKTSALIESDRDMTRYERKLLKIWIQSFLLGVPKVIVGMRNKSGLLQRLEEVETQKIPTTVKRVGKNLWDGAVCLNFTASFLSWIRDNIGDKGVWRIRRRATSSSIELFCIQENGHGGILNSEFIQWRQEVKSDHQISVNVSV